MKLTEASAVGPQHVSGILVVVGERITPDNPPGVEWRPLLSQARDSALKTAAKILGGLAFSALYVSCNSSRYDTNWGGVVIGLVLGFVAAALYQAADSHEQNQKDTDAYERVQSSLNGKQSYYYLYLRPFSLTNNARMKSPRVRPVQDSLKPEPVQTFEATLDRALRARGIPLMGLGKPGEAIGAGRIQTTEENWQTIFAALAKAASGFIVVPALTSGTWWEIDWLVQHKLIHKTVFIFPQSSGVEAGKLLAGEYNKLGLRFPEDGARSILKLSEEGDVIARFSLDILQSAAGGQLIQEMKLLE